MVKFYGPKRRKMFDEDADWLPPKNRLFVMKQPTAQTAQEPKPEQKTEPKLQLKKTTDKEGLKTTRKTDTGLH